MPDTILFPTTKMLPREDPTDRAWFEVAQMARDFEDAAKSAHLTGDPVARCRQLHERLFACLQTLNAADDVVRLYWNDLLSKGMD